jgi:hypothetical protein
MAKTVVLKVLAPQEWQKRLFWRFQRRRNDKNGCFEGSNVAGMAKTAVLKVPTPQV